jgi:hypothetical protein
MKAAAPASTRIRVPNFAIREAVTTKQTSPHPSSIIFGFDTSRSSSSPSSTGCTDATRFSAVVSKRTLLNVSCSFRGAFATPH